MLFSLWLTDTISKRFHVFFQAIKVAYAIVFLMNLKLSVTLQFLVLTFALIERPTFRFDLLYYIVHKGQSSKSSRKSSGLKYSCASSVFARKIYFHISIKNV